MPTHNPKNERIKRQYFLYLKEAQRYGDASISATAKALARFEAATKYRDFRQFHREQAVAFKRNLAEQSNARTGDRLSKSTLHSTLQALRKFFLWLAGQPGFRSCMSYSDADFFNVSEKDLRVAKADRGQVTPTLNQIQHLLSVLPYVTDIERRNRALVAFTILTGARDGALASFRLKHVDLTKGHVLQDAREVRTKFSKTISTWFFPVGNEPLLIVSDWINHLISSMNWGQDDPLFPATRVSVGASGHFEADGLARKPWSSAAPIRAIFRDGFQAAGLPYFKPHSFRRTLVQLGERLCKTPEEFKAWSQNLGHNDVLTTFTSYGDVSLERQAEIIRSLADLSPMPRMSPDEILARLAELLPRSTTAGGQGR